MNRSRSQCDTLPNRSLALHKPGVIPNSCRNISSITANRHKYELKQKIWPKQTIESWFENHSTDDRRAVFSFLNTLNNDNNHKQKEHRSSIERHKRSPRSRLPSQANTINSHSSSRRISHESRASKRDLGEILQSLEGFRPSSSVQEKGIQTSATPITVPLPDVNEAKNSRKTEKRPKTSLDKYTEIVQPENSIDNENNQINRRYLSHTWRVINPREDMEPNVRPENNASSFFNYTKKIYPEYFFIHPDWY